VGAADFTRLSLGDLNLSAAVEFRLQDRAPAARDFIDGFEAQWSAARSGAPEAPDAPGYWSYRLLQAAGLAAY
jgi:hypothetical protein